MQVCDMGMARVTNQVISLSPSCSVPSPNYSAPEVLRSQHMSDKADVFSFGCVLWEIITRREPWKGQKPYDTMKKVSEFGQRLPLPAELAPEMASLLRDCWQEEPAARPDMEQVLGRLESLPGLYPVQL